MLASLMTSIATRRVRKMNRQSAYSAALDAVPETLLAAWRETAHLEFKGIPQDPAFFARALEGLMMFFDCASRSARQCGLPSRAADSVWHAWARMDQANLKRFCTYQFRRPIPHVEAAEMQGKMGLALAVCLVQARKLASKPPAGPTLPQLFTLDSNLKMPQGIGYKISLGLVGFSALDAAGQPGGEAFFPDDLTPQGLFQAGLISKEEHDAGTRVAEAHGQSWSAPEGGYCGSGAADSGDNAGCDGGSTVGGGGDGDGGGSCGGGCGGGGCGS